MSGSLLSKKLFSHSCKQRDHIILLFFPFHFSWCEILLRVLSGTPASPSLLTAVLAASGIGAVSGALLCMIRKRSSRAAWILSVMLCLLSAFFFAVESMLRSIFFTYMTPGNILSEAGDVAKNYMGELARSLLPGLFRFLLFLLPAIVLFACLCRNSRKTSGENAAFPAEPRTSVFSYLLYAAAGFLLIFGSVFVSHTGRTARLYGSGYSYHAAVDTFGLVTATRLDIEYSLLGNPYETFSSAVISSDQGEDMDQTAAAETENTAEGSGDLTADAETAMTAETVSAGNIDSAAGKDETAGTENETVGVGSGTAPAETKPAETKPAETESGTAPAESGTAPAVAENAPAEAESAPAETESVPPEPEYNVMNLDFSLPELHSTKEISRLTDYISSLAPSQKNEYTGLFAGKNLILVCAESYCDRFITPELTPTLWRLTHNGFYFEEYYESEWGGSTTTGELAFTTGLCGNNGDDSLSGIAANNHYFTMGNQLQRQGYSSIAFHSGHYKYYKRHTTHENLGYNQFLGVGNGIEDIISYEYAPDSDLFENTIPLYLDHQPFSVYYMTLSGHAPYVAGSPLVKKYYDRVDAVLGDEYAKKTKYYICYQMELEAAMTLLVQRLEEAGIADDTVIVLTGDHYPYGLGRGSTWKNDKDYIKDLIKGDDFFRWEQDRSGLIIWSGCLEHDLKDRVCKISEPVGNLDILPTISNLFGVPFDSRLLPGRDVLAPDTEPMVFWNNFSVVVKEGKYDGRKLNWYPNEGYEWTAEDPDFLENLHARVNDRLLMGRMIMQTDYYRLLFGEDTVKQAGETLWKPAEKNKKKKE